MPRQPGKNGNATTDTRGITKLAREKQHLEEIIKKINEEINKLESSLQATPTGKHSPPLESIKEHVNRKFSALLSPEFIHAAYQHQSQENIHNLFTVIRTNAKEQGLSTPTTMRALWDLIQKLATPPPNKSSQPADTSQQTRKKIISSKKADLKRLKTTHADITSNLDQQVEQSKKEKKIRKEARRKQKEHLKLEDFKTEISSVLHKSLGTDGGIAGDSGFTALTEEAAQFMMTTRPTPTAKTAIRAAIHRRESCHAPATLTWVDLLSAPLLNLTSLSIIFGTHRLAGITAILISSKLFLKKSKGHTRLIALKPQKILTVSIKLLTLAAWPAALILRQLDQGHEPSSITCLITVAFLFIVLITQTIRDIKTYFVHATLALYQLHIFYHHMKKDHSLCNQTEEENHHPQQVLPSSATS